MHLSFLFVLFISCSTLNKFKTEEVKETEFTKQLKNDLEEMHQVKNNSKLSACMALVRNNLSEENQSVKLIIQAGKFDKSKTFDKIVAMMINTCMTPDSILTYNKIHSKLIEFDAEYFKNNQELVLTVEEENFLNKINEIAQTSEYDNATPEDDIGFVGMKLNQLGATTYIFLIIGIILSCVIIFGGFYMLKKDKKPSKDKKKKDKKE